MTEEKVFNDEIFIDGHKVIDIPMENIWYTDKIFDKKSFWSEIKIRKKIKKKQVDKDGIVNENVKFNPLQAITQ